MITRLTGTDAVSPSSKSGRLPRWLLAALLIAGLVILVVQLAPQTIGETARRHLQQQLQSHYPDCRVLIRRGIYQRNIGLIFEGIRLSEPDGRDSWSEAIYIEKLVVVADFDRDKIASHQIPLVTQKIVIDGLHIKATIDDAGQHSLARFWPPPKLGPAAPRMEVRNAEIQFAGGPSKHPLSLQLSEILLTNDPVSGDQSIAAAGSAAFIKAIQLQSKISRSGFAIQTQLRDVRLNNDLFDRLPAVWTNSLRDARGFDGLVDATLKVSRSAEGPIDYLLRTTINTGRFNHAAMPKPISQISGLVTLDPRGVHINALQGKFGDAIVRTSGLINPSTWPDKATFNFSCNSLLLDEDLARRLPPSVRANWDKLRPYGHIDIERATLRYHDGRWISDGVLHANGVSVCYEKMPYPAEQLVGRVEIADGIATCYEMTGRVGGRHMRCAFRLPVDPGVTLQKLFRIRMDGPVAIDDTLVDALTPRGENESKLESFVRSLHPQGAVHVVDARLETDAEGRQSRTFDLRIVNGNLRYEKFAYPLYNVTGQVRVADDLVWLQDFEANDSSAGQVSCHGWYRMPRPQPSSHTAGLIPIDVVQDQPVMQLQFNAAQIAMDGSLRSSLPTDTKLAWDAISPSGVLDQLDVIVTQQHHAATVTSDITAIQHDTDVVTNRTLSLQPPALPYRLDVLGGSVRYDGQDVSDRFDSIPTRRHASFCRWQMCSWTERSMELDAEYSRRKSSASGRRTDRRAARSITRGDAQTATAWPAKFAWNDPDFTGRFAKSESAR